MGQRSNWSCMFLISFGFCSYVVALISWSVLKKVLDCLIQFWSQSQTLLHGTYKWLPLVPVSSKEKSRGIHSIASWTTGSKVFEIQFLFLTCQKQLFREIIRRIWVLAKEVSLCFRGQSEHDYITLHSCKVLDRPSSIAPRNSHEKVHCVLYRKRISPAP